MRNNSEDEAVAAGTRRNSTVAAVDRAMRLLAAVSERGDVGVTEAARELGMVPSSASRLFATMAAHGFVEQGPGRRYRPGPRLGAGQTQPASRAVDLASALRSALRELYDEVGETVHLMVLVGRDIQFIDGIEGTQPLRIGLRIGARMPAYTTSGGKAILAELDDAVVDSILGGGLMPWASTRTSTLEQLHAELAEIRIAGVAVNLGEPERGVQALGVAVGPTPHHPLAAITVSVPSERFTPEQRKRMIASLRRVRERARSLLSFQS